MTSELQFWLIIPVVFAVIVLLKVVFGQRLAQVPRTPLLIALVILNILDVYSTFCFVSIWGEEAELNPVFWAVKGAINMDLVTHIFIGKVVLLAICAFLVYRAPREYPLGLAISLALVVGYNYGICL